MAAGAVGIGEDPYSDILHFDRENLSLTALKVHLLVLKATRSQAGEVAQKNAARPKEGAPLSHSYRGLSAARVCDCLVNQLKELAAVHDLNERSSLAVGRDHPDGGRVFDADTLAQCVIGFDRGSQLALGIDGKWQGESVALGVRLGILGQIATGIDGYLVRKNIVTIVVAQLLALCV